jgi:hypothetical protein
MAQAGPAVMQPSTTRRACMPSFDLDWIVLQDAPNPRRREKGRGMRFKTKTKQGRRLLTGVTRRRRRLA